MNNDYRKNREKEIKDYLQKKKDKEDLLEGLKFVFALIALVVSLVCSIIVIIYRFKNPALTETQIAIYSLKKYWWSHIMLIYALWVFR